MMVLMMSMVWMEIIVASSFSFFSSSCKDYKLLSLLLVPFFIQSVALLKALISESHGLKKMRRKKQSQLDPIQEAAKQKNCA